MTLEEQFEQENIKNIIRYNKRIERILNQASKDLAKKISVFELKYPTTTISKNSFYLRNKGLKGKINIILNNLHKDIGANIKAGIISNWNLSNLKNDELTDKWASGIKLAKNQIPTSFNQLNMAAMDTFIARTTAGLNISERVWNLVNGAKDQVELLLSSGITTGKSAAGIARDIKIYLNEPERLFRRVRQEGKLVLSKAARGYKPGSGIYRSSFQNAKRLARNEINMSYRMSDYTRRKQLPFITGIMVHLSASHNVEDMCDSLTGKYPPGFIWMGWHVNCYCYTTTITLSNKDSLNFMKTGKIAKSNYIAKIPTRAENWIKSNTKTIAGYKNTPFFIADNFDKNFNLMERVTEVK